MSLAHIVFSIALAVLGVGVYAMTIEGRRLVGLTMVIASVVAIGLCAPSLVHEFSSGNGTSIYTNGGGTGGTKAGGGGGGAGAPGGTGGTYIEKPTFNFGVLRTVALGRVCTQEFLPFSIPPNTSSTPVYIIQIHPKNAENVSGWIPQTIINTSGKIMSWPPRAEAKGPRAEPFSTYRCEFQNLGEVPFLSVNVEFLPQFVKPEPKGFKGTPPIELQKKVFVITETIDTKQKFVVYLVNASHNWVYCWYPIAATVQLVGENGFRKIPVNSSTATFLNEIQFATLAPTQFKWQGLP